jgi:NAD(P)H dehydrogenase (quinone)
MSIVVTGATGHLGRLIVESLLARGVPAGQIVAAGRDTTKAADLAARGVTVRHADYQDVQSLKAAFAGADKLMFVSGSENGRRVPQHTNVIEAAQAVGAGAVVYTSTVKAATSSLALAAEHKATEEVLTASGLPFTVLRNGWYVENYTPQIPAYLEHGIAGAAGDGRIAAATRADLAEAAAAVLTTDNHQGRVYELGGEAFTMAELAAEISRQTGRSVTYTDLPEHEYTELLVRAGLPRPFAALLADADRAASIGELYVERTDLETLLGRPVTPLASAVRAAL